MSSSNHVHLIGNLVEAPELRYTPQGTPVCEFRLAHNRTYTTSSGQKKEDTLFIGVTFWKRQAEVVSEYHQKGDKIAVSGELKMERWETDQGTRSKIVLNGRDFTFFKTKGGSNQASGGSQQNRQSQANTQQNTNAPQSNSGQNDMRDVEDNEIPF